MMDEPLRQVEVHVELDPDEEWHLDENKAIIHHKPSCTSFAFGRVAHLGRQKLEWADRLGQDESVVIVDARQNNSNTMTNTKSATNLLEALLARLKSRHGCSPNVRAWHQSPVSITCSNNAITSAITSASNASSGDISSDKSNLLFTLKHLRIVSIRATIAELILNLTEVNNSDFGQLLISSRKTIIVVIAQVHKDLKSELQSLQNFAQSTNTKEMAFAKETLLSSSSSLSCSTVIYKAGSTGTEEETEDSSIYLPDPRHLKETLIRALNREQFMKRRLNRSNMSRKMPLSVNSTPIRRQRETESHNRGSSLPRQRRNNAICTRAPRMPLQGLVAGRRKNEVLPHNKDEKKKGLNANIACGGSSNEFVECWVDGPKAGISTPRRRSSEVGSRQNSPLNLLGYMSSSSSSTTTTTKSSNEVKPFAWLRSASDLQQSADPSLRVLTQFRVVESSSSDEESEIRRNTRVVSAQIHQQQQQTASSSRCATLRRPLVASRTNNLHQCFRHQHQSPMMSTFGRPLLRTRTLEHSDTEDSVMANWPMPEPMHTDQLHFINTRRNNNTETNNINRGIDMRLEQLRDSLSRLIHVNNKNNNNNNNDDNNNNNNDDNNTNDDNDDDEVASLCSDPGTTSACESSIVLSDPERVRDDCSLSLSLSLSELNVTTRFDRLRDLNRDLAPQNVGKRRRRRRTTRYKGGAEGKKSLFEMPASNTEQASLQQPTLWHIKSDEGTHNIRQGVLLPNRAETSSNDSGFAHNQSVRLRTRNNNILSNNNNVLSGARSRMNQCGSSGYESFNDDVHQKN